MIERLHYSAGALLRDNGFARASVAPVPADWSDRRFFRVSGDTGSAILIDWPGKGIGRLAELTDMFAAHGVSVPAVLAIDTAAGLALIEDLGSSTMAQLLDDGCDSAPMLLAAVDLLIHLHKAYPARALGDIPLFDAPVAAERAGRFCDHYLPAVGNPCLPADRAQFVALWQATWPAAGVVPMSLAHYDFHPGNLFWRPECEGSRRCAVIDFQDAVLAPVTFDLSCLIQDVRRTYAPDILATLRAHYYAAFPRLDSALLDQSTAVVGAQRATQILGNLGRSHAEGRLTDRQKSDMRRAWAWLDLNLEHPVNAALKPWYDTFAPRDRRG